MQVGDLVIAVGGERVASLAAFLRAVWRHGSAGVEVALTLARGGAPLQMRIRSADRQDLLRKPRLQ